MFKEQMMKIKNILNSNNDGNNKKKIENLVVFVIILIITILVINSIWNNDKKDNASLLQNNNIKLSKENIIEDLDTKQTNDELETKLENILKSIDGVGNVKVLLTYSESNKKVAMYNEDSTKNDTEEKDTRRW